MGILDFFKPNSGLSSKRLIALSAFIVLVILAALDCAHLPVKDVFIEVFFGLAIGGSITTLFEKKGEKKDDI